jgi:hypothetical protein
MNRARMGIALTCCVLAGSARSLEADVRADQKTHVEFGGMVGKIVNIFGGKAAREGVTSIVAVKGDRKATLNDTTGRIIDLNDEKIYDLDLKKKTYTVTTFAELRREMEEAQRKAAEQVRREPAPAGAQKSQPAEPDKNAPQVEIDFDLKNTGEKKIISGFDTHEVVMTITVREKGKTLEEAGGLVLTSDMWMTPKIAAMREVADFDLRYARKMMGPVAVEGASAQQMATVMAMYPSIKDALGRMNAENVKMDGTSIDTTMKIDAVKSAAQIEQERQQQQQQQSSDDRSAPSVNSMLGKFAKKVADKRSAAQNDPTRATLMTMTDQVLKVTTEVTPADVSVPAGFKESK